jgi:hypothetical protein
MLEIEGNTAAAMTQKLHTVGLTINCPNKKKVRYLQPMLKTVLQKFCDIKAAV